MEVYKAAMEWNSVENDTAAISLSSHLYLLSLFLWCSIHQCLRKLSDSMTTAGLVPPPLPSAPPEAPPRLPPNASGQQEGGISLSPRVSMHMQVLTGASAAEAAQALDAIEVCPLCPHS